PAVVAPAVRTIVAGDAARMRAEAAELREAQRGVARVGDEKRCRAHRVVGERRAADASLLSILTPAPHEAAACDVARVHRARRDRAILDHDDARGRARLRLTLRRDRDAPTIDTEQCAGILIDR